MRKILVTGFIRTTSPLHITTPSSDRFDPSTGKKVSGGKDIGVPCTSIQTIGVPTPRVQKATVEGEQDTTFTAITNVPVIGPNNLAGRIRRQVAYEYLEAHREAHQPVSLTTYSAITCGSATGSPDGMPITYDEFARTKKHPFLGIMGGGPRMMPRKTKILLPVALCDETKDLLSRTRIPYDTIYDGWGPTLQSHSPEVSAFRLTGLWGFRKMDDLKDLAGISLAANVIEDFTKAFTERQAKIIEEFKGGKDEGTAKTSLTTYQGLEFVIPGTTFPFTAALEDVTDAQAGLWFRGFDRFLRDVNIGGWSRCGFGDFVFLDGRVAVFEDGEMISCETFGPNQPDEEDSFRVQAMSAWFAEAKKVTSEEINYLMRLPAEKSAKGRKKAEAAEQE